MYHHRDAKKLFWYYLYMSLKVGKRQMLGLMGVNLISQKPPGSRAGHLHVLALGWPCSR